MLESDYAGKGAAQRMSRAARAEFERATVGQEKLGNVLNQLATAGRKNPFRHSLRRLVRLLIVFREQRIELSCKRANRFGRIGFSDNLSKLLSAVRGATGVARLF